MFFERQVSCLTQPEKYLVEAFRVLVFGALVNPMPLAVYEAFWATAAWGTDLRRTEFELAFSLVIVSIDELSLVQTLVPEWFVDYNAAVEDGEASTSAVCRAATF